MTLGIVWDFQKVTFWAKKVCGISLETVHYIHVDLACSVQHFCFVEY